MKSREHIRARYAKLEARRRALQERLNCLKREFEKLELDCDHPKLWTDKDYTGYPEYGCDDCGMDKEGVYIPM